MDVGLGVGVGGGRVEGGGARYRGGVHVNRVVDVADCRTKHPPWVGFINTLIHETFYFDST